MAKSMKVLFLPNNCEGVVFWRMYQFYNRLKEKNIDCAFVHEPVMSGIYTGVWEKKFEMDVKFREKIYNVFRYADIIVAQYIYTELALALMVMAQKHDEFKCKIITEIDDLVSETPVYNPAYKSGAYRPDSEIQAITKAQLKISDAVVCSTQYLSNALYHDNKNQFVMPNAIDFRRWNIEGKHTDKTTIGWIGGGNHKEDLRVMEEVIPVICKKYPNVVFKFSHGAPDYLKKLGKRVICTRDWVSIFKYPQHMAEQGFDIGIAPLEYNKFNMAKSNLKFLELSALKIPTVAQNICTYNNDIINGKNGYLCKKPSEWIEALIPLIENKEHRLKMGEEAYKYVYKNYNLDDITDKYTKMLNKCYKMKGKVNEQTPDA